MKILKFIVLDKDDDKYYEVGITSQTNKGYRYLSNDENNIKFYSLDEVIQLDSDVDNGPWLQEIDLPKTPREAQ